MKNTILLILLSLISFANVNSQILRNQSKEIVSNQGVPTCPGDPKITELINSVGVNNLLNSKKNITKSEANICREIGILLNKRGLYDAADWYLERSKSYVDVVELAPEAVFENPKDDVPEAAEVSADVASSLASDKQFLSNLPESYDDISPSDMKKLANEIENKLQKLIEEKEQLLKRGESKEVIDTKEETINKLGKEKNILGLNIENGDLKVETKDLKVETSRLKTYLIWASIGVALLILAVVILFQRKVIRVQDEEIEEQLRDIGKKNIYLEHAARIIRHDMHSGINTYIPRGITSLEKRLNPEEIKNLKIEGSVKMIKEGLSHTQKVYKNVYEFTNLVKQNVVLDKKNTNLTELLKIYINTTSYGSQVSIGDLVDIEVNDILFCNAIDNLIRNGLKYNDNNNKYVNIYMEDNNLVLEDNGRGLSQKQFDSILNSYSNRKNKDIDKDTHGLGLNICKAILQEHGFDITSERLKTGTKIKIKIN
jgi:light-regulated signal transduction histidine kinase (bacteriophytochrome)